MLLGSPVPRTHQTPKLGHSKLQAESLALESLSRKSLPIHGILADSFCTHMLHLSNSVHYALREGPDLAWPVVILVAHVFLIGKLAFLGTPFLRAYK